MVIELIFSIFSIVFPVVLVVWAVRQFGNRTGSRGMDAHSIRRFFQYLLLFGLMIVAAVGLSDLLGLLFQEPSLAGDDRSMQARALTFSVFGIPMFVLLAVWSRRHLQQDPDEARSLGWAFYATVAPLTALVVAMTALHGVVSAALAGQRFDGSALSQFMVWSAVWLVHWTVANRMLEADRRQGQLVLGSLIGLGTTVAGLVWLLGASLDALLVDRANTLLVQQQQPLAQAAATVVVGVPVWVVYWLRSLSRAHPYAAVVRLRAPGRRRRFAGPGRRRVEHRPVPAARLADRRARLHTGRTALRGRADRWSRPPRSRWAPPWSTRCCPG